MRQTQNEYNPDSVSPPGETLEDILDALGMSQADLAERTGRPKKTINEIIKAKAIITSETAVQLERVLKVPAAFWITREAHYQAHLAAVEEEKQLEEFVDWPKKFPIKEMRERGLISQAASGVTLVRELLSFLGIARPEKFEAVYHFQEYQFRKAEKFQVDTGALAVWLRHGELAAQSSNCADYDRQRFMTALRAARALTVHEPSVFVPKLKELCSEAGVVVVFVPEFPKTRTNGVTRWITPNKALIQLSLRYKRNDILWFTFFHEAGHVLLHGKKDVFIEVDGQSKSAKEDEADEFAKSFLMPSDAYRDFVAARDFSEQGVRSFADGIGVHPAIVVGRLRRDSHIQQHWHANLIMQLQWAGA